MFWALLSGIGACSNAGYYIVNKKFLERLDPNVLAATGFLCTGAVLLGIALIRGIPVIGPQFLLAAIMTSALNVLATTLTFRALTSSDISLAVPMLSFTPLFLVFTAALFLGEYPSLIGILGILTIVGGSYVLNTAAEHERITDPFRAMVSHPGVMYMLVVAFLYAVAVNFDKMVVQNSDTVFGSGIMFIMIGSAFVVIAGLSYAGIGSRFIPPPKTDAETGQPVNPLESWKYLLAAGAVTAILITIEAVTVNTAYLLQIVPYVIAIKRMSIILIVLYGTIVFREKEIGRRLAGAGLMVLGAVLILTFP